MFGITLQRNIAKVFPFFGLDFSPTNSREMSQEIDRNVQYEPQFLKQSRRHQIKNRKWLYPFKILQEFPKAFFLRIKIKIFPGYKDEVWDLCTLEHVKILKNLNTSKNADKYVGNTLVVHIIRIGIIKRISFWSLVLVPRRYLKFYFCLCLDSWMFKALTFAVRSFHASKKNRLLSKLTSTIVT